MKIKDKMCVQAIIHAFCCWKKPGWLKQVGEQLKHAAGGQNVCGWGSKDMVEG